MPSRTILGRVRNISVPSRGSGRSVPSGSVIGRVSKGTGRLEVLGPNDLPSAGVMTPKTLPNNISAALDQTYGTTIGTVLSRTANGWAAVAGGTTVGDMLVRGASGWQLIAAGPSGDVLTSNGAASLPTWQASSGGSGPKLTRLTRTTTQSIANNTDVTISWNTTAVEDDVAAFASGSPTIMTTPSGFTRVSFNWYVIFASSGGNLWSWITQNGTEVARINWQGVNEGGMTFCLPYVATAHNDVWAIHLFENIGGAITLGNSPRWPLWQASWLA